MTTQLSPADGATVGDALSSRRLLVLAAISLAQLMVYLDSTIVAVALPSIQRSVGLTDVTRQWAVTAYTLSFGGLLLLGGRIGDMVGRKRPLLWGVAGFALASALGGLATNPAMLIGARALQGVSAALIAPSTLSLISTIFVEARERSRALAAYAATGMVGGALGLVLGGVLTSSLGWRWCLFVNLPIAAGVLAAGITLIPDPPRQAGVRLDVPGVLLGCGGMGLLIFALGEAGADGWGSSTIVGCLAGAVLLLVGFVVVQARVPDPLLPLRVVVDRNSGVSFLAMAVSAFCTYGMLLGMTYQFQTVMGYSALKTGLAFLAYVLTAVAYTTQVARRLVTFLRPGPMIAAGLATFALALVLLEWRISPTASFVTDVLPVLVLFGVGVGNLTVPIMSTVMTVTEPRDAGIVSAVVSTAQQVGGSIGAALLNSIAIGAAATYLATHPGGRSAEVAANVHGFAVACTWSAVVALVGAAVALLAIDHRTRA